MGDEGGERGRVYGDQGCFPPLPPGHPVLPVSLVSQGSLQDREDESRIFRRSRFGSLLCFWLAQSTSGLSESLVIIQCDLCSLETGDQYPPRNGLAQMASNKPLVVDLVQGPGHPVLCPRAPGGALLAHPPACRCLVRPRVRSAFWVVSEGVSKLPRWQPRCFLGSRKWGYV